MEDRKFTKIDNGIMIDIIKNCGANSLTIYMIILSHRNSKTNKCFPSLDLIAKETNTSRSTVQRAIKKLYEKGFLIIDSGKQGISNSYYFPREIFYNGEGITSTRRGKGNFAVRKGEKQ